MYGFQGGINPNQFSRSAVVMQAKENGDDDVWILPSIHPLATDKEKDHHWKTVLP